MTTGLHERLNRIAGQASFRSIGEKTGLNAETVRRYMKGQSPSVEFVAAFCKSYDVNEAWLLTGRGPAHASDVRRHQLSQANPGELLAAVADALERLTDRVDRIEQYIQTMETRLRARSTGELENHNRNASEQRTETYSTDAPIVTRGDEIADALSRRPSQNAD